VQTPQLQRSFTLVELMVVVGIIMVISGLAIPNYLQARAAANEASAGSTLRAIHAAQDMHKLQAGEPGDLGKLVDSKLAPETLEEEEHSGYGFAVVVGRRDLDAFAAAVAWPLAPGLGGSHVLLITPEGRLHRIQRDWASAAAARRFAKRNRYHRKFNSQVLARQGWALVGN
jgi:type II secretory pathway pseudopilin PulG